MTAAHQQHMQAVGRERDSIELFKEVEEHHPVRAVRSQAGNLKFIMEVLPLLTPRQSACKLC